MSTRQLVLIRHAKAAGGTPDVLRPLAAKGVNDAAAIGKWLTKQRLVPDRAVVSPARRTVQTWEIATGADAVFDERVYDNTIDDLLEVVRETPADVATLVIVGHNPSMGLLAAALDDGTGDSAARRELAGGYPTSGIAVFGLHEPWHEVGPQSGELTSFAVPRAKG